MSQKLIIGIMGAVILVGGGAWFYQTNVAEKSDATASKNSPRATQEEKDGGILGAFKSGTESFADILRGGSAQECRFSGVDPDTKEYGEGTIYVDGESFRLEAETKVDGEVSTINMIQHEMVMYMWSDEDPSSGLKIDASIFEGMEGYEKPESPINWLEDPESDVKYECRGWSPRGNSFEPPEEVVFIDMFGAMGNAFGEMMREGAAQGFEEEGDDWDY